MSASRAHALAHALVQARLSDVQIDSGPWADALPDTDAAYAVQAAVAEAMGWPSDSQSRAWKSGGPSRAATLTHAALPAMGVRQSSTGSELDFSDLVFHAPGIEAEIALRLGADVTQAQAKALSVEDAWSLVDAMTVSIEIVDSRWLEGNKAPALLRLADLQSHGALALGSWQPASRRDWLAQTLSVHIGHQPPHHFSGSHALGDPGWLLPIWLRHATRDGQKVTAATVVTTGTWCGLINARSGDMVQVTFDGIGAIRCRL